MLLLLLLGAAAPSRSHCWLGSREPVLAHSCCWPTKLLLFRVLLTSGISPPR